MGSSPSSATKNLGIANTRNSFMAQIFKDTYNQELIDVFNAPGRVFALDFGRARVGLAISDDNKTISLPITTIKRQSYKGFLSRLKSELVHYNRLSLCVIGFPLSTDGKTNKMTQMVRDNAHLLVNDLNIDILLFDERLSTKAVYASQPKTHPTKNPTRKLSQKAPIDHLSATFILQGALDWLHSKT